MEYQPSVRYTQSGIETYDLEGNVLERLVYKKALSDLTHKPWLVCAELPLSEIHDLEHLDIKSRIKLYKCMRNMGLMLIMLGFGDKPQDVLDWFRHPSYGQWVKDDVPYMLSANELGGKMEVKNPTSSIDGFVSFSLLAFNEEVDLTMGWDRFLLSSTIDVRIELYEGIEY